MSLKKGDKSRYHRERRKNIARRAEMRALRAKLNAAPKTADAAKTS